MNNLENGYVIENNLKYVDLAKDLFVRFKLKKGDILFNRTNTHRLVGKTGIFLLQGDFTFASYLIRLETNSQLIDSSYLNFYLNLEKTQNKMRSLATKGVGQSNINAKNLKTIKIPIPKFEEQQKIASILSKIDENLAFLEKHKEIMVNLKKKVLNDLIK